MVSIVEQASSIESLIVVFPPLRMFPPHEFHLLYDVVNFSWHDAIERENRTLYFDTRVAYMYVLSIYTRYIMHRFINRQDVASRTHAELARRVPFLAEHLSHTEILALQRFDKFPCLCGSKNTIYSKKNYNVYI